MVFKIGHAFSTLIVCVWRLTESLGHMKQRSHVLSEWCLSATSGNCGLKKTSSSSDMATVAVRPRPLLFNFEPCTIV